jgi:Ca-activated chloride channel family protein
MAKKHLILFILWAFSTQLFSQLVVVEPEYDFGTLRRADPNWIDFQLQNKDTQAAVIFRVESPANVDTKMSTKSIPPGEVGYIRVAISPNAEGKFKEELLVYASPWKEPRKLKVSGTSTYQANGLIPCPDFGNTSTSGRGFHFSVRTEDIETAVEKASIRIYSRGKRIAELETNKYGEVSAQLPYGQYYYVVEKGSSRLDTAMYANAVNNHLLAVLPEVQQQPSQEFVSVEEPPSEIKESFKDLTSETNTFESKDEVDGELPLSQFKRNNLVFLVDVSSSMKSNGKLDLLKISMIELLEVLREVDRFSLISYASNTEILLETDGSLNREACAETISNLEAKGSTAGAEAIRKAAELALNHFIEGGNNQVILATDGAFNDGVKRASRLAKYYKSKGIELSVIGIKCAPYTEAEMEELVESSQGRYIPIRTDLEAGTNLIEEIKKSSKR